MEANQILQSDILDILFEGKNKLYGAYDLRKTYDRRITTALILTIGVILFLVIASAIGDKMGKVTIVIPMKTNEIIVHQFKPDLPKALPKPELPKPVRAAKMKFNLPVIVKDKLVAELPPNLKKIENAQIDNKTIEGPQSPGITNPPSEIIGTNVLANPANKKTSEDIPFRIVEIEAMFPGGPKAWQQYVQRAIMARLDEFAESDYGTCIVQFIVDKNGNVSDVKATTMQGTKLAEIAVNAIMKGPKWIPAIQNGRYVNAYRVQPVTLTNPDQ